jgi:hypothetical protein
MACFLIEFLAAGSTVLQQRSRGLGRGAEGRHPLLLLPYQRAHGSAGRNLVNDRIYDLVQLLAF